MLNKYIKKEEDGNYYNYSTMDGTLLGLANKDEVIKMLEGNLEVQLEKISKTQNYYQKKIDMQNNFIDEIVKTLSSFDFENVFCGRLTRTQTINLPTGNIKQHILGVDTVIELTGSASESVKKKIAPFKFTLLTLLNSLKYEPVITETSSGLSRDKGPEVIIKYTNRGEL